MEVVEDYGSKPDKPKTSEVRLQCIESQHKELAIPLNLSSVRSASEKETKSRAVKK